jgi:hypothetical protein
MRIVELQEVKEILGLTDNTYDDRINRLLPLVQRDVIEYLNNYFPDKNTRYDSGNFVLINAEPPTIGDTRGRFLIEGFEAGMDIALEGSYRNRDIYTIATASSETLTLAETDSLYSERSSDEYGGNRIYLTRCDYPKGLKMYISQIIWHNIDRALNRDIKSRSLGPSSVTYESIDTGGYPPHVVKGLAKYRRVKVR